MNVIPAQQAVLATAVLSPWNAQHGEGVEDLDLNDEQLEVCLNHSALVSSYEQKLTIQFYLKLKQLNVNNSIDFNLQPNGRILSVQRDLPSEF